MSKTKENMEGSGSGSLSIKSIIFFVVIFGLIIYAYYHYESLLLLSTFPIVRVLIIIMAGLSVAFPHIMDYLKYYDGDKYSLEDVMKAYHR